MTMPSSRSFSITSETSTRTSLARREERTRRMRRRPQSTSLRRSWSMAVPVFGNRRTRYRSPVSTSVAERRRDRRVPSRAATGSSSNLKRPSKVREGGWQERCPTRSPQGSARRLANRNDHRLGIERIRNGRRVGSSGSAYPLFPIFSMIARIGRLRALASPPLLLLPRGIGPFAQILEFGAVHPKAIGNSPRFRLSACSGLCGSGRMASRVSESPGFRQRADLRSWRVAAGRKKDNWAFADARKVRILGSANAGAWK